MLTKTDSSLDGVLSINDHDEFNQSIYRAIVDIASANITNEKLVSVLSNSLWETHLDRDTVDHLDGIDFAWEAALVSISRGELPADNPYFQRLVVSLAYNAITNSNDFAWLVDNSRYTQQQIQEMIDLAANVVTTHPNFELNGSETFEYGYNEKANHVQYLYEAKRNLLCQHCGK